jgi:hypothetical protein
MSENLDFSYEYDEFICDSSDSSESADEIIELPKIKLEKGVTRFVLKIEIEK